MPIKSNSADIERASMFARRAKVASVATRRRRPAGVGAETAHGRLTAWLARRGAIEVRPGVWATLAPDRRTTARVGRRAAAVARLWRRWSRMGYDVRGRLDRLRELAKARADMGLLNSPIVRDAMFK